MQFCERSTNENTVKKTNQIVKKFFEGLENELSYTIDPHKLNNYLGNYILEAKKMGSKGQLNISNNPHKPSKLNQILLNPSHKGPKMN